ncbi:MAG: hypothetical protein KatS3mg110_0644 [Pirellulaceae bacterium]|nr:MAG: hypothetical protein KatS3mg110_0644 [Pirellulaceae bacterium]
MGWLLRAATLAGLIVIGCQPHVPSSPVSPAQLRIEPERVPAVENRFSPFDVTYRLHNVGGRPLKIDRIESSCTCLQIRLPSPLIMPGDNIRLTITVEPRKLGVNEAVIRLFSNDLRTPVVPIKVQWTSVADFQIEPSELDLGIVAPGEQTCGFLYVRSDTELPELQLDSTVFGASVERSRINRNEEYWLIELPQQDVPGRHRGVIRCTPTKAKARDFQVALFWNVADLLELHPSAAVAYFDPSMNRWRTCLELRGPEASTVKITEMRIVSQSGHQWEVDYEVRDSAGGKLLTAFIDQTATAGDVPRSLAVVAVTRLGRFDFSVPFYTMNVRTQP